MRTVIIYKGDTYVGQEQTSEDKKSMCEFFSKNIENMVYLEVNLNNGDTLFLSGDAVRESAIVFKD